MPFALGLRGRLLISVTAGMAVLLCALTAVFNLVLASRLDADATRVAQARAAAGLSSLTVGAHGIGLTDAPDERSPDPQLWVFQGGTALEQPAHRIRRHGKHGRKARSDRARQAGCRE